MAMFFQTLRFLVVATAMLATCQAFVTPTVGFSRVSRTSQAQLVYNWQLYESSTANSALAPVSSANSSESAVLAPWQSFLTRLGLIAFIVSMCIALPATLLPQRFIYHLGLISKTRKENWALRTSQRCARYLMRLIPFCRIQITSCNDPNPMPSIWVCNHTSMLDVFLLLAADKRLRGPKRRPIKVVYWKGLESNPVTKLLFRQAGFIPVQMAANGHGEDNEYDVRSFRQLLKDAKQAFAEGFDIAILPEGQLNPTPEKGLLPVFSGAFTLAKLAKRPIHFMAMHGANQLWHPLDGMKCSGRTVKLRCYPYGKVFGIADEFTNAFERVVGEFGRTGTDPSDAELRALLGSAGQAETSTC